MPSKLELALCVNKGSLIDIFDIHTGVHLRHISGNFGNICILHDSLLISCDNDKNNLSVYNYRLNQLKWSCSIPKETKLGPICVSSTSPFSSSSKSIPCDPRFLFCGSSSGHIYCWCLLTGNLLSIFKAHLQSITVLTMSHDGNLLISGSNDCLIKVWKLSSMVMMKNNNDNNNDNNGNNNTSIKEYIIWKDHILGITDICCANNQRIFSSSMDCTVKIYSLLNKQLISSISFPNPLSSIRIDPANIYLLVASNVGQLWRINMIDNPKFKLNADIQHIQQNDTNCLLSDVTYKVHQNENKSSQRIGITSMDISYDGRLAVTTHCDGTAIKWDIKYGSKMSVFNKQRKSYDQIILVCDRLGAFAQNENDIKYEKFTWINKNFPKICKRFTNRNDDECKSNNISLKNVPNYLEINIECNDDKDDKDEYDEDDDESFLNEIDQEFDIINNSINECIETNNIDILKKNIRSLMEENKALKGEIIEWKSLHQNLYNMKIDT